jgi:hypothetical protein
VSEDRRMDPDVQPEHGADQVFDNRDSNPNASGPEGLEGGMGVSSERTGPEGDDPRTANPVENTGTKGSAVGSTDGGLDTSPAPRAPEDIQGTEGVE